MTEGSGAGDEERCQPGLDIFGDFLGGAILGVPEGAGTGEPLIAAGHVIGHAGEGGDGRSLPGVV